MQIKNGEWKRNWENGERLGKETNRWRNERQEEVSRVLNEIGVEQRDVPKLLAL